MNKNYVSYVLFTDKIKNDNIYYLCSGWDYKEDAQEYIKESKDELTYTSAKIKFKVITNRTFKNNDYKIVDLWKYCNKYYK